MSRFSVTKCVGTGNDFVLLDRTASAPPIDAAAVAKALCDRHLGIGADGLLLIARPDATGCDIAMRIFNSDSSEAEMCGNGVRCVARYLFERRPDHPRRLAVQTVAGTIRTEVLGDAPSLTVRVGMGVPDEIRIYDKEEVAGLSADTADVLIGNPHSVAFVDIDPVDVDLPQLAHAAQEEGMFENGVNVEVARILPDGAIAMRVFERGVGETLACGTGACAVALAAMEMGRAASPVRVQMRGGDVTVEWSGPGEEVYLTGAAELVFDTTIDVGDPVTAQPAAVP